MLDYARHLFSGLPTDAGDAAFAARRDRANAGLVSRYPAASIRLAVRVDEILRARFPEYGLAVWRASGSRRRSGPRP